MNCRITALLMLAGVLGAGASSVWAAPQPIPTNKTRFRIPFKIDPAALQRLNARELQLHVSRDGGVTWEHAQSLPPEGAKFEYSAAADGEYWFAVKTLDGRNQLHPPRDRYETGLIVQVDTLEPLLELTLQQLPSGQVQLSWNAADTHLDVSTLKLEYLPPGAKDWEPIEVIPKPTGDVAWTVSQPGQIRVRGTVADTATNVGRGQSQFQVIPVGDPVPKPRPGRRVPIAGADGHEQAAIDDSPAPGFNPQPAAAAPPGDAVATVREPEEYRGPVITPFGGAGASTERFVAASESTRPEITRGRWDSGTESAAPAEASATATLPSTPAPTLPAMPTPRTASSLPAATPPRSNVAGQRIVNSRRFQVGYTIDDVGPSGVGAVELFITQDQGRKWWKYGEDADRRSPFDVEVPQDGEYGFAIRVRSGVGLTNDPPLPNEPPAVVVVVDQTPPVVELLSAHQGQGNQSNRVQIRWRISDHRLASKPVSIYTAPTRSGPWEPVSGWSEDQGGIEWTVAPGSPPEMYIRVVARDAAGNMGRAESQQPILVDLSRPTARIVDVEAPQGAPPR